MPTAPLMLHTEISAFWTVAVVNPRKDVCVIYAIDSATREQQ